MRNLIFFLVFCLGFSFQVSAQTNVQRYETITLKDGSTIEGFLKHQSLIKSHKKDPQKVQIFAKRIERTLADSLLQNSIGEMQYNFAEIEIWWQDWFDAHKQFIQKTNGKEYVTLNQLYLKPSAKLPWGNISSKVKVLERGTCVKFVEFPNADVTLNADLISKITYPAYNPDILSGVMETVTTRDNHTYKGYLAYLVPGKLLGLYLADKPNQLVNISFANIQRRVKEPCNVGQTIEEQSLFLDVIETVNNRTLTGCITAYDYGNKKDAPFISFVQKNVLENVLLKNIKQLSKIENGDYRAVRNVKVKDNEILFGEKPLNFRKSLIYGDLNLIIENKAADLVLKNDSVNGKLVFYLNDIKENKNLSLIKVKTLSFRKRDLRALKELSTDSLAKGMGSVDLLVYDYKEIVKNSVNCLDESYSKGIIKRTYYVTPGNYILYCPYTDKFALIKLK